ncbi:MAG: protein-disulfide reductase DsbD family protein [Limibacillus sp.]
MRQRRNIMGAIRLAAAAFLLLVTAVEARATAGPWLITDQTAVRLIAASDGLGEGGEVQLGLQFRMEPGWKIYWRSPGSAGYPPSVEWDASQNLEAVEIHWPLPHRFELFGLQTFGYGGEVVLPLTAAPADPGQPLRLEGMVNFLTCSEICVPQEGEISLSLPAGGSGGASEQAALIEGWRGRLPGAGDPGLTLASLELAGDLDDPRLEAVATSQTPFESPDLLVEGPPGFFFGKPEVTLSDGGKTARMSLAIGKSPIAEGVVDGKRLRLTLMEAGEGSETPRGIEETWLARYETAPSGLDNLGGLGGLDVQGGGQGLFTILFFALLGGLILNIMPCVLPVLSLKLLSVASQGGKARSEVRLGFLASAAGILVSFLVLALGALALKGAGLAVGWGIQFQQPLFLAGMTLLLTAFALNLFGLFEFSLPGWAGRAAEGASERGLTGHFMTGALATLLATPCSAPFLGTAVGFALARGPFEILLIFLTLGLGLALPYLLVALLPGLARALPKPGSWMITLRRILGLAMAGTAVWLLTVLARQIDVGGALAIAALLLALSAVTALRNRALLAGRAKPLVFLLAAAVLAVSFALPKPEPVFSERSAGLWQPYDAQRLEALVGEGRVVLVDVTADWCITCKVNKSLVLERGPVLELLEGESLAALKADWTNPDPAIAAYLESFGRYGIPFNAVYGPGAPEGIALPELLTESAVLEAVEKARGG